MAKAPAFDLAGLIKALKIKEHNCAVLLGKEGPVIAADPRKNKDMMKKQAKAAGGGVKGITGTMKVQGGIWTITCDEDPPPAVKKELRKMITDQKVQVRVELFGPSGAAGDDEGEGADGGADPQKEAVKTKARDEIAKMAAEFEALQEELAGLADELKKEAA